MGEVDRNTGTGGELLVVAHFAALIVGHGAAHLAVEAVEDLGEGLGDDIRPTLTKANCRSTVACVYKNPAKHRKGLMSYRPIADKLDVTAREAEAITEMLQKPFPASSRFEDGTTVTRLAPAGKRDTDAVLRRMEIRRLVEEYDAVPSCRKLQRMLLAAGIKAGHVTVMADLKAMQLVRCVLSSGQV